MTGMVPTTSTAPSWPGSRSATSEMGEVHREAHRKHLRRRGLLVADGGAHAEGDADPESSLAASVVSGLAPPAGPQWMRGL